jgi:hypothetical protein
MAYLEQFAFNFPNLFTETILNTLALLFGIQMKNKSVPAPHSNVSKISIQFYVAKGVKNCSFELKGP